MDAVVFDFDGVIADSEVLHDAALREVCEPHGIAWEGHPWVGWADADVLREVFRGRGGALRDSHVADLLREKTRVVLRQVERGEYRPYPGSLELIRECAASARVGVCSAGLRDQIIPVLEHFGVLGRVGVVVACEDTPRSKPDPAPYVLAASRLGVRPGRSIAIEDSPRGVASARSAGFTVVAVGHTSPPESLAGAHHFSQSTAELTLAALRRWVGEAP